MHCAAQPAPRITKAKTHFGSRLSRPADPQVVAVVAVAAGALSKSASKLNPGYTSKGPRRKPGAFLSNRFRETGPSLGDKPSVLVAIELSNTSRRVQNLWLVNQRSFPRIVNAQLLKNGIQPQ